MGEISVAFDGEAEYIFGFSRLLVQDGGLAIRYLPHLKSAVVLVIHENSLSLSKRESAIDSR